MGLGYTLGGSFSLTDWQRQEMSQEALGLVV